MSEIEILTGSDTRLLVREWEGANGRRLIAVAPEYRDRRGVWRLQHSGLTLAPDTARALAPTIVHMAANIDGAPIDPQPTAEDREASRMP